VLRSPVGLLGGEGAPCEFDALPWDALPFGAPEFGAPVFGAAAAGSGSGRGLLTCGVAEGGDVVEGGVAGGGITAAGAGLGAAWGVARSGDAALPGPNTKTWPTEMRKSAPMLFHRANSRKSRLWRQAML
jgi:hypothetical protein